MIMYIYICNSNIIQYNWCAGAHRLKLGHILYPSGAYLTDSYSASGILFATDGEVCD
jgi:hypothetical protein